MPQADRLGLRAATAAAATAAAAAATAGNPSSGSSSSTGAHVSSEAQLSALYQELILDHYRRPRNKGRVERPDAEVTIGSPICMDELALTLTRNGDRITDVRFTGRGCSISQAAASMLTELVKGKTNAEVAALGRRFAELLKGDAAAAQDAGLGDLRALAGVARFPTRQPCALLAWRALAEGLGLP